MSQNLFINRYHKLVYSLSDKLCEFREKPIILCIGSDKVIADSLGPLVGHFLVNKYNINAFVYGKLGRTIQKQNLQVYYKHILNAHKNKKILVVDASLGSLEDFGQVKIKSGGIVPIRGEFVKPIGDVSITAIVLPNGLTKELLLKQTKLHFVYELAESIAKAIYHTYQVLY